MKIINLIDVTGILLAKIMRACASRRCIVDTKIAPFTYHRRMLLDINAITMLMDIAKAPAI
jgi:hypothetical protein